MVVVCFNAALLRRWAAVVAVVGGIGQTAFPFVPLAVGTAIILVMAVGILGLGWGLWTAADEPRPVRPGAACIGGRVSAPAHDRRVAAQRSGADPVAVPPSCSLDDGRPHRRRSDPVL